MTGFQASVANYSTQLVGSNINRNVVPNGDFCTGGLFFAVRILERLLFALG